jgi:FAD/FMN-containing dehydrogenase
MISATALTDTVAELSKTFAGQLLQPADAGYDDARNVHNGLIDKRPALIARCRCVADIVDAIKLAREQKLEVAVRGGGHNVAGLSTIDGGVMIDLSPMTGIRSIRRLAPRRHRAALPGTSSTARRSFTVSR